MYDKVHHKGKDHATYESREQLIAKGRLLHSQAIGLAFLRMVAHFKYAALGTGNHREKQRNLGRS